MNENNIPDFLIKMINEQYGKEVASNILDGYKLKKKVTIRVNTLKADHKKIKEELSKSNINYQEISWNENILILENVTEDVIRKLSIYENGEIYMQNISSMLPAIILEPKEGENILDMAAAPGGKTTQIAAITENKSYITACEMNKIRAERLKYNLDKQGVTNTYIMVKDARELDDMFSFDKILLDAPCSGSGTILENDNNLKNTFTKELIKKSNKRQMALLKKAIKLLKPGKEMVYSTCSVLKCENEDIIEQILKLKGIEIIPINFKGIDEIPKLPTKIQGTLCVCPTDIYEGFFVAKLKKK